jgi:ferrochelatase
MSSTRKQFKIVLVSFGCPDKPGEVRQYLRNIFSDRRILPTPMRSILARIISHFRAESLRKRYSEAKAFSVNRLSSQRILHVLQKELRDGMIQLAFLYSEPLLQRVLRGMQLDNSEEGIIIPLYPQYAYSTYGTIQDCLRGTGWKIGGPFYRCKDFIKAVAQGVKRAYMNLNRKLAGSSAYIFFTAHSIPMRDVKSGDPYEKECKETVRLVMEELSPELPGEVSGHGLYFQSRVGPVRWLGPSLKEGVDLLSDKRIRNAIVVPVSFIGENLEILYDLDIVLKGMLDSREIGYVRARVEEGDRNLIACLLKTIRGELNG